MTNKCCGSTILASGRDDATVLLWEPGEQDLIGQPLTGQDEFIQRIVFSPDGEFAAAGEENITFWDTAKHELTERIFPPNTSSITNAVFSPDGRILAWPNDGATSLRDVTKRDATGQLDAPPGYSVTSLAFSPDGKALVSGSDHGMIMLWDSLNR